MSEPPTPMDETAPKVSRAELVGALVGAVLAVPGVVRLEPTLSTSGPEVLIRRSSTDGLHVLTRNHTAEVDVNIATSGAAQARAITHQVQAAIAVVLDAHGYLAGPVAVSVLTIDPS